jgi:hypothetical protein
MKKLLELSRELKIRGFYKESFLLGYYIAKIAAEQLELFNPEDIQYKCTLCGGIESEDNTYFKEKDEIIFSGNYPEYKLPDRSQYPVCYSCNEDKFHNNTCPLCTRSYDENDMVAVDIDNLENTYVKDKFHYTLQDTSIYPICYDCYGEQIMFSCEDCSGEFEVDEEENYLSEEGARICKSCYEEYLHCSECGTMIDSRNDTYRVLDSEVFCEYCTPENPNDNEDLIKKLKSVTGPDSIIFSGPYVPLSDNTIKVISNPLKSIVKRYDSSIITAPHKVSASILDFISKTKSIIAEEKDLLNKLLFDEESQLLMHEARRITLKAWHLDEVKDRISKEYAPVKNLKIMKNIRLADVVFDVDEPRDSDLFKSFVVTMMPSKEMIAESRKLFGKIGPFVWSIMSERGSTHHDGSIAYARISGDHGEWVIDNLQRDSDLYNFKKSSDKIRDTYTYRDLRNLMLSFDEDIDEDREDDSGEEFELRLALLFENFEKTAKWWNSQFKSWGPQMVLAIQAMAREAGVKLYMTTFEIQKNKWRTIPNRSRDVYDRLPEELNRMNEEAQKDIPEEDRMVFPRLEDKPGKTEDSDNEYNLRYDRIWRIAKRKERLKIINS